MHRASNQALKQAEGFATESLQALGMMISEILDFPGQPNQAFGFSGGSAGDAKVPPELRSGTKCVSFDDVGFDGYSHPATLLE